jgi:glycine/D-amino acid oxidase-like deaminating enzyme
MGNSNPLPPPSILFRIRVVIGLLLGLRCHDFRAARTFVSTQWPDATPFAKLQKFLIWSWRQVWFDLPDIMRDIRFSRPVSRVPFWLAEGNPLANHPWCQDPRATLPEETDTVAIGCGLAGSALAYHWGKHATDARRLIMLEMNDVASGSAGRNEGLVVMGRYFYMVYKDVLKHLTVARPDLNQKDRDLLARQFAAAYCNGCYRNADLIETTIRKEGFECDYAREGWVQVRDENEQNSLQESVQMALDSGFDDWTSITPEQVKRLSGMRVRHNAGFSLAAATFHPAKWCWSLVQRALERDSFELYSHTRVVKVEDLGEYYLVRTQRGDIRARNVVNCTESYTALLHRQFSGLMRPTQTQAAAGTGGPESLKPFMGVSGTYGFYGRHGNTIMVGSDATRVPDHQAGRIQPSRFLTKFCIAQLKKVYGPFDYQVNNEWSGTVTYTPDEFPVVGTMDGKRQYIIGGMAGSGSAVGFNGARCIVNRILGRTQEPDDFLPEYFSPTRLLDPTRHSWPNLQAGESVRKAPCSVTREDNTP